LASLLLVYIKEYACDAASTGVIIAGRLCFELAHPEQAIS